MVDDYIVNIGVGYGSCPIVHQLSPPTKTLHSSALFDTRNRVYNEVSSFSVF